MAKAKRKNTQSSTSAHRSIESAKKGSDLSAPPGKSGEYLTTNQGVRISDNHNSLKAGTRGPTLLEDFVLREKITNFDHERIPERVVHARGAGAFGYFECTEVLSEYTSAGFLGKRGKKTPVLVRFSTVAGSRGSADTARDVRGFATKFYTDEGNFDLVGNNIPVFFIHDAMKPDREIPQAQTPHDTFWDFVSLMPESTHMLFWIMSDRAIPRSYRMMEGFGVHTFRLVDAEGRGNFVKFHWKPKLGAHSVLWEESLSLAGQDPDFHRRDLYDAIENGFFPEWELGVQLVPEEDEFRYPFDLLDPTKIIPEELVPVRRIGRLILNRIPDNFFSEIEQAAFNPGNLVPGIDVTNDPLLQGRLFSYTDTQLIRLGGPNFHELPVNRPLAPVHKVRARSPSFNDHFSQAKLFFDSQTPTEQEHIKDAFAFELSNVKTKEIRERVVGVLANVNKALAHAVAEKLGVEYPEDISVQPNPADPENSIVPQNISSEIGYKEGRVPKPRTRLPVSSTALSLVKMAKPGIETRKIAVLVSESADLKALGAVIHRLKDEGAFVELIGPELGRIGGSKFEVAKNFENATSLHYDAVWVAEGAEELLLIGPARRFVLQAWKHCKTIGGAGSGSDLCERALQSQDEFLGRNDRDLLKGVILSEASGSGIRAFIQSAKLHRIWSREIAVKNLSV